MRLFSLVVWCWLIRYACLDNIMISISMDLFFWCLTAHQEFFCQEEIWQRVGQAIKVPSMNSEFCSLYQALVTWQLIQICYNMLLFWLDVYRNLHLLIGVSYVSCLHPQGFRDVTIASLPGDEDVLDQHIGYFQPWHVAPFWVHTPSNFEGLHQSVNLEMRQMSIESPSSRWHCVQTMDAEWNEHLDSTPFCPTIFAGAQNPFATLPFEAGLFEGSIALIRQGGGHLNAAVNLVESN